jgi:hypothetical protein
VPRRPKDPNNVITRLREALSSPTFSVTRECFCARYGFSLDSITALERGTYRLTREMAQRIALATGVSSASLLLNSASPLLNRHRQPLLDWDNKPVTSETKPPARPVSEKEIQDMRFFLKAAIEAAKQSKVRGRLKDRSTEFSIMLREWIQRTIRDLGAEESFWKLLFGSWREFNPDERTVHLFNPNVHQRDGHSRSRKRQRLSGIRAQLLHGPETRGIYIELWNSRNRLIEAAKTDILCEVLPKKDAVKLRRWFEERGTQKSKGTAVEEGIRLESCALTQLAKNNGVNYDASGEPSTVLALVNRLALEKLAAEGRQLSDSL